MSILSICQTIAEKIKAVYAKGKTDGAKEEHGRFWDSYQNYGNHSNYSMSFAGNAWNDGNFYPKYTIKPVGNCSQIFYNNQVSNIKERLEECGVALDFTEATLLYATFTYTKTTELPTIDCVKATSINGVFNHARNLISAPLKNIQKCTDFGSSFNDCPLLADIGQESDDFGYFSASVNLSQTAIDFSTDKMSLLLHLNSGGKDQSKSYLKINPSGSAVLTLSADQIAVAQAHLDTITGGIGTFGGLVTGMGWTLATPDGVVANPANE